MKPHRIFRRMLAVFLAGILAMSVSGGIAAADEPDRSPWPIMPTDPVRVGACWHPRSSEDSREAMEKGPSRERVGYPSGVKPGPNDAQELVYVALGDSYASGEGAPETVTDSCDETYHDFIPGTALEGNHCHRSGHAYPVRLWAMLEQENPSWSLDHRACSGATTKHFEDKQSWDETLGPWNEKEHEARVNPPQWAVDPEHGTPEGLNTTRPVDLVTITMTGNDLGFADIVGDCVQDIYTRQLNRLLFWVDCSDDRDVLIGDEAKATKERLLTTFRSIKAHLAQPNGRLIVVGYPQPFPTADKLPDSCGVGAGARIQKEKMGWLNTVADQANTTIREAAFEAEVTYVNVTDLLQADDHTMCEDVVGSEPGKRWINRIIPSNREWSAHPNAYMHQAQADRMLACFEGRDESFCHHPAPIQQEAPVRPAWNVATGPIADDPANPVSQALQLEECNGPSGPGLGTMVSEFIERDLTGDGIPEAVMSVECVPSTSSWPEWALVFDGAAGPSNPIQLGPELTNGCIIGFGNEAPCRAVLRDLEFSFEGNTVTVFGTALSPTASNANPDLYYQQDFSWNGQGWDVGKVLLDPLRNRLQVPETDPTDPCAPPNDVPEC